MNTKLRMSGAARNLLWPACWCLLPLAWHAPLLHAAIIINELHYDPDIKTEPVEFVELYNTGPDAIDLGGGQFSAGIDFAFPAGSVIASGGYAVVAQDPVALSNKFGVAAFGPWSGKLANDGEKVNLRDASSNVADTVTYGVGSPWPTAAHGDGSSMELVNPALPRTLPGSWRSSGYPAIEGEPVPVVTGDFFSAGASWQYRWGLSEPSVPRSAWRAPGFAEDGSWLAGTAAIGYGDPFIATVLTNMRYNYTTVYLRKQFTVENLTNYSSLLLEAQYDDGFVAWINGTLVASANVPSNDLPYSATALAADENYAFRPFVLANHLAYLVPGTNVIAIQLLNASLGGSSDAFLDARLTGTIGPTDVRWPTPGRRNSVYATNAPPLVWDVAHTPRQPTAGAPVLVTARIIDDDDGVSNAVLWYQRVLPGQYVRCTDSAYSTNWIAVALHDDGLDGDGTAGDTVYSATLPAALQSHRALVRYRIGATDATGGSVRLPHADDPVPNFAYFCYNGVPAWQGAVRPGTDAPVAYGTNVMQRIQAYHLLTARADVEHCTWLDGYTGDDYLWTGTLVTADAVYDNIPFRARGGVWRYAMGKNMWKFKFPRGHEFLARDDRGQPLPIRQRHLNFSACIQQGNTGYRGEQGMFETVGFKLFNLAGCPASQTHWVQFRIIDDTAEQGPTQYDGDFWGLYLAIEEVEGQFLDAHDLPDGNLYKMENWTGTIQNQGATGVSDSSDMQAFLAGYATNPPSSWWRANANLDHYFAYRIIIEAIHHYDNGYGKNYFYYLDPTPVFAPGSTNFLWTQLPWDLDLTWATMMYGNGEEPFKAHGLLNQPDLALEYRNAIRNVRDLLYNTNEAWRLIDDTAAFIDDPSGGPSIIDADRAMWDYNPVMTSSYVNPSKAGVGRFYTVAPSNDFPSIVAAMKQYVVTRSQFLDSLATDADIPATPGIAYLGTPGFPVDDLRFQCSAFSDPQGAATFAALEWRIGEIAPSSDPAVAPLYEISPVWTSADITAYTNQMTLPPSAVQPGHTCRVRVRMKDTTGRWSHWSAPIEFVPGAPMVAQHLRVTELMYHPAADDLSEFVELYNTAPTPLVVSNITFSDGIGFMFSTAGTVAVVAPTGYAVIVQDIQTFATRYDTNGVVVAGQYSGALGNAGEALMMVREDGIHVQSFAYSDTWYPQTDGGGYSLVINDPNGMTSLWNQALGWRPSGIPDGTPGGPDVPEPWGMCLAAVLATCAGRRFLMSPTW